MPLIVSSVQTFVHEIGEMLATEQKSGWKVREGGCCERADRGVIPRSARTGQALSFR
ncbi:protein of unknown function [Caballeronia sp. S22]